MKVILYGFFLHIVFLLSVFDIYFKSPITNNIPVQHNDLEAPAKRLVLFVADGLRADSIYSKTNDGYLSPHLRLIINTRGKWGVAHCRVPTESRPGHIALIAGFYEDPSAVFSGWKDNLVEFDSVFNRSAVTYSWGSPDIVPMFKKGALENKVQAFTYDAEDEDFSGHGSTKLNTWVFRKVEQFLNEAKTNNVLNESLNSPGVVFFLHLLGPDVAGHANKPHSSQYKDNIKVVDEGVNQIEKLFSEFYKNDNKTAFIFTSDHGMTDWGSHGAGSSSETQVPLIVWGAGAAGPLQRDAPDPFTPERWGLRHLARSDTAQADLCPLMAMLIGVPIPVHSVGVLPLEYLSLSERDKALALLLNAEQLIAHFDRKREVIESTLLPLLYTPFSQLTFDEEQRMKKNIMQLIEAEKYNDAMEDTKTLIQLTFSGLEYYHLYFQGLLLTCVTLSFMGWIAWLMCQLSQQLPGSRFVKGNVDYSRKANLWPNLAFFFLITTSSVLIYVQSLPLQFYVYCSLPLVLWWSVVRQRHKLTEALFKQRPVYVACFLVVLLVLLELLVFTFFERRVLSLVITAVGFWPLTLGERRSLVPLKLKVVWVVSFLTLAIFPVLPVVGSQTQTEYVILCGGLWVLCGLAGRYVAGLSKRDSVTLYQLLMLVIATVVVTATANDFQSNRGLQLLNQLAAWFSLVAGLAVPLLTQNTVPVRFASIGLGLAVPFLLLCVGHEAFFLLVLFISLCDWLAIEAHLLRVKIEQVKYEETAGLSLVTPDDFRKCFFFLMFIILSFFGTGNIASVNSFDVSWVRCFLTVFSPFLMMTLILLKTAIPFLLVTCCFRAVNIFSQVKAENMFVIVLIYCDLMGLHFLYAVTNKGSWLEIGTSISHFVIMEATVLFLASLYGVARLYTSTMFTKKSATKEKPIFPVWMPDHKTHPD